MLKVIDFKHYSFDQEEPDKTYNYDEFEKDMNALYIEYFEPCVNLILDNRIEDIKKDEKIIELMLK